MIDLAAGEVDCAKSVRAVDDSTVSTATEIKGKEQP